MTLRELAETTNTFLDKAEEVSKAYGDGDAYAVGFSDGFNEAIDFCVRYLYSRPTEK